MCQKILMVDPDGPAPYTDQTLNYKPMGGTEATICRVARGLTGRDYKLTIAQGARRERETSISGVEFIPFALEQVNMLSEDYDKVIVINTPKFLKKLRRKYPKAGLYLWMHCFPGKRRRKMINKLAVGACATVVVVSNTHRKVVEEHLYTYKSYGRYGHSNNMAEVVTVYNPVDDDLLPYKQQPDPHKFVFFSSPHKGLQQVLEVFSEVKKHFPDVKLYIANPGYWPMPDNLDSDDIVVLGSLTHKEVIEHVREAFCVFYPQSWFKETFGLVLAEANAAGTPVIAHPVGASPEILQNKDQLIDVTNTSNVVNVLKRWYAGDRPKVKVKEAFRLSKVLDSWERCLVLKDRTMQKVT